MITKNDALTKKNFLLVEGTKTTKWRANGICKTWVTRPNAFKLPIKHGLYDYGYITEQNAHQFILE